MSIFGGPNQQVEWKTSELGLLLRSLPWHLSIYKYINHYAWWLGPHLCRFWIFSDCFFCTVSVNCLVSVAFDRFQAVLYPMKYARTSKTALQVQLMDYLFIRLSSVQVLRLFYSFLSLELQFTNVFHDSYFTQYVRKDQNGQNVL